MRFGVGLPNYGKNSSFDAIRRVALAAEELGFDSVWTTDHVVVPKENAEPYGRIFESIVTLAIVSAITQRVQVGTSVLVLPMRNPVLAAKQLATIDAATNGRVIVGLGVGWNASEFRNLNASFGDRGRRLDEDISLLRSLWSNANVDFAGKYTQIHDSLFDPLPARKSIPIWIGGNDEPSYRRAAAFGDAWHPTGASPEVIAAGVKRIKELGPARPLTISARLTIDLNPSVSPYYEYRGAPRRRLAGTDDAVRSALREYAQAGLEHAALWFQSDDDAVARKQMERFMRDLAPEFVD